MSVDVHDPAPSGRMFREHIDRRSCKETHDALLCHKHSLAAISVESVTRRIRCLARAQATLLNGTDPYATEINTAELSAR
jgi:hypothetical protein